MLAVQSAETVHYVCTVRICALARQKAEPDRSSAGRMHINGPNHVSPRVRS